MRYWNNLECSRLDATRRVMFLIYGTEEPSRTNPPLRLLTRKKVAEYLRVPIGLVNYLCYKYFNPTSDAEKRLSIQPPKLNAKPSKASKVTVKTVTAEELEYIIDPDNLRTWSSYSLDWRCTLFHRKFPNRWISRHTLSSIMRRCGIKKKVIVVKRAPQRLTQRLDEFEGKIVALNK